MVKKNLAILIKISQAIETEAVSMLSESTFEYPTLKPNFLF